MTDYSRRTFIMTAGTAMGVLASGISNAQTSPQDAGAWMPSEDEIRKIVSASDLLYSRPVVRSEDGIPVGNGRMGSIVWTKPDRLCFQINRVDLFPSNRQSNSFFEAHNDYCGGCAFLDICFSDDVFPSAGFVQHLSVYNGVLSIECDGISIRVVPFMSRDVFSITIDSKSPRFLPISAVLRMLRYERKYFGAQTTLLAEQHAVRGQHLNHAATSRLIAEGKRIFLTQDFREEQFCSKSAVAVAIIGNAKDAQILNDLEAVVAAEGAATITVLVASAATMDRDQDVVELATQQLQQSLTYGIGLCHLDSQAWWHNFWTKSFVSLRSDDGTAESVQQAYHYFLYLMAATSRGEFPPKFNGMLWNTGGDLRAWGGQYWFANTSCLYEALPATGHFELMMPFFDMYSRMVEACATAAQQQWGSKGIYIPETVYFDGLEQLPDSIASEMQELYLLRKPWEQRSQEFMAYARSKHLYSSRWNWISGGRWDRGQYELMERNRGPYGPTNHSFATTAKIAYLYWRHYEYTLDREWLEHRAYPMLAGAVEFYRNHPNVKREEDGKYHIHWSNSNETIFGARDTDEDLSAMHGATAALLKAAQLLGRDEELHSTWHEFHNQLAPLPTSAQPEALNVAEYRGPEVFVHGLKPAVQAARNPKAINMLTDENSLPAWFFDLCNVESEDRERLWVAVNTFNQFYPNGVKDDTAVGGLSKLPIAAASLGLSDPFRILVKNQMCPETVASTSGTKRRDLLLNRMDAGEGTQAISAERLGRGTEALHMALLQSNPPLPGADPILHVFPAWPKTWDARYVLWARGGFLVKAAIRSGVVEHLEIESQVGASCQVRNPFGTNGVQLFRNGKRAETLRGDIIQFLTTRDERIVLAARK